MMDFRAALSAEILKLRRSKVPLATLGATSAVALVASLFMIVLTDPDQARRMGLLRQKAEISGMTADWAGLLGFLAQVVAVGDLLLFAFIATWVFGREAADGTLRYLLALPVSRTTIVAAKFTVTMGWGVVVNLWLFGLVLVVGRLLDLPGGSPEVIGHGLATSALAAVLMLAVTTPIAFAASAGRGYLPPLGVALAALVVAQVAAALGWAGYLPWSIPAAAAGLAPDTRLEVHGVIIATTTAAAGIGGTISWWRSSRAGC